MRSRYSAHALGAADYLAATHAPPEGVAEASRPTNRGLTWTGLEIVAARAGGASDDSGTVEFRAHYRTRSGERGVHHEKSRFSRIDGRWMYVDGDLVAASPASNPAKPGRNAPCPCGSGRKFKRCCGA